MPISQTQGGFSLLEVLIACSLSCLAVIAIYSLQIHTTHLIGENQVTQAAQVVSFDEKESDLVKQSLEPLPNSTRSPHNPKPSAADACSARHVWRGHNNG